MNPDRFRVFTKRGATLGVVTVVASMAVIVAVAAVVALFLTLVF